MVFYRKYRPQKIEELDNERVRETLVAVLSKSPPHAFLFTGPKGLGKTSAARIVAKVLNCERGSKKNIEPCNKCYQCQSITSGNNLDVIEIDGASNRGIDEVRDLREKVKLSTAAASKKVYIIDEVHMLTQEAFNALLKTLEEPPSHVVFIFCTTEPQKVPATIASRCFHVPFTIAIKEELLRSFKRIVSGEKLKIDKEALEAIASLSDRSFRDGAKILEELVAKAKNKKITKEVVEKHYQVSNITSHIENIRELLRSKRLKTALELVSDLNEQGVDSKYFVEQLIENLHQELISKITVGDQDIGELKNLLVLLSKAHQEIKYAVIPSLPLELAIVEYCVSENSDVQNTQKTQNSRDSDIQIIRKSDLSSVPSFLDELIAKVKPYNHSVAGLLRGCHLKSLNGKRVEIETGFKFHKEKLEDKKTKELLEKVASELLNKNVKINISFREVKRSV